MTTTQNYPPVKQKLRTETKLKKTTVVITYLTRNDIQNKLAKQFLSSDF
jgi:hypothetical protein